MAASIQPSEVPPTLPPTSRSRAGHETIGWRAGDFVERQEERAEIAQNGPVFQALVLANSDGLDENLIDILARRPEPAISYALAANNRLRINRKVLRALIERGRDDRKLAQFLLRREDLHLCHLRLFLHADSEQRRHLIAITCRSRLGRLWRGELCHCFDAGKLARLELAALNRDVEAFKTMLAHALSCDLTTASRIAEDKGGEALALVMVALGLSVETIARVLQFGFPDICMAKPAFRSLIGIVGRVPRPAAIHIAYALINEHGALAA